jgi:hypothetical protein
MGFVAVSDIEKPPVDYSVNLPLPRVRDRRLYCTYDRHEITAWLARGAFAWVSVNFRKFSPCIARARRARAGLTVYPPSRTLELLAFDE